MTSRSVCLCVCVCACVCVCVCVLVRCFTAFTQRREICRQAGQTLTLTHSHSSSACPSVSVSLSLCLSLSSPTKQVIAATNRVDILDPALLRSGRLDRKIEFPHPDEDARARIMQIHSRQMNLSEDVNFQELARCTDDFNGAQCKAVCVEAVS